MQAEVALVEAVSAKAGSQAALRTANGTASAGALDRVLDVMAAALNPAVMSAFAVVKLRKETDAMYANGVLSLDSWRRRAICSASPSTTRPSAT